MRGTHSVFVSTASVLIRIHNYGINIPLTVIIPQNAV